MKTQQNFKRYEKKYLINEAQYQALRTCLDTYMSVDQYDWSTICNIYYDTPDYRLIRTSIEKPVYKEKMRLRTYGIPVENSPAFIEVKKKFKGIVYKRRMTLPYQQALDWLAQEPDTACDSQIAEEICWFRKFYGNLSPAVVLCYDRLALYGNENKDLRVTFDRSIRWRTDHLDLTDGDTGEYLLPEGFYIMEIKIPGSMPLWMADLLDRLEVYPTSFSKYGRAYQTFACRKPVLWQQGVG
ncbi:MAG: polyphosphate polymerase domain-containing protein [Eubacterium sp.]|nr:polyphosphate polymerase domain-containing protein [Eubacterium sp.]